MFLRNDATVTGDLTTGGTVSTQQGAAVEGNLTQNGSFQPGVQGWTVTFAAHANNDVQLEPDQEQTLVPGAYRHVRVKSRAKLFLSSGTYYLDSLEVIEPEASLVLDDFNGPVIIYVKEALAFRGNVTSNLPHPDLVLGVVGEGTVRLEAPFRGTVVAPNADIVLATGAGNTVSGAFYGKSIEVQPDVVVLHNPSSELKSCCKVPIRAGLIDIEGYVPGHDSCEGSLDVEQVPPGELLPGTPAGEIVYRVIDRAPNPGVCRVETVFCAPGTDVPLDPQPTLEDLNGPAPEGSTCAAVAPVDRCMCPVDEATLGGTCETSSDCAAGEVCARVCADASCTEFESRCGRYRDNCNGLPEEENCQDIWECPDPAATGEVTREGILEDLPLTDTPGEGIEPEEPAVPRADYAPITDDLCNAQGASPIKLPAIGQEVPKGTEQGNKTWGVFIEPKVQHSASITVSGPVGNIVPDLQAGGSFAAGANVFGKRIEVISATASAHLEPCQAAATGSVRLFGQDVDSGASNTTPNHVTDACLTAEGKLQTALQDLVHAQQQVWALYHHLTTHGVNEDICEATRDELGVGCGSGTADEKATRVLNAWRDHYIARADQYMDKVGEYAAAAAQVSETLPFLEGGDEFTVLGASASFPVGPLVVTIDTEVYGEWGVNGSADFTLSQNAAGPRASTGATVTPYLNMYANAFAGVGLPGVSLGVEADLVLVGTSIPISASIGIERVAVDDPRVLDGTLSASPYAGEFLDSVDPKFAPLSGKNFAWDAAWSLKGDALFDLLSGRMNAAARIRLLFVKKTFRKEVVSWKGINLSVPLVGVEGSVPGVTDALEGLSDIGELALPLPFTLPSTSILVHAEDESASFEGPQLVANFDPDDSGSCFIIR